MTKAIILILPMASAWVLAPLAEAEIPASQFLSVAERFGIWAALSILLIVVILYFSWKRELRMATRIDQLEAERAKITVVLTENGDLLKQSVKLQEKQLEQGQRQLEEQQRLATELRCRPCIKE